MIAYCGLVCSNCPTFLATQNDDDVARRRTAVLYSERFGFDLKPEEIYCDGCKSEGGKLLGYCQACAIRQWGAFQQATTPMAWFVLEETGLREYNSSSAFGQSRPAEKWCLKYPYFNMVPMMRDLFTGGSGSANASSRTVLTPLSNVRSPFIIGSKRPQT